MEPGMELPTPTTTLLSEGIKAHQQIPPCVVLLCKRWQPADVTIYSVSWNSRELQGELQMPALPMIPDTLICYERRCMWTLQRSVKNICQVAKSTSQSYEMLKSCHFTLVSICIYYNTAHNNVIMVLFVLGNSCIIDSEWEQSVQRKINFLFQEKTFQLTDLRVFFPFKKFCNKKCQKLLTTSYSGINFGCKRRQTLHLTLLPAEGYY